MDWDGKYIIVEDALANGAPNMWVISAVADTLQAARSISTVDSEPVHLPKNAFSGAEIARTLILRSAKGTRVPQHATIYQLKAGRSIDESSQSKLAPEVRPSDPSRLFENALLQRAGVATTDKDVYARLNMLGYLGSAALSTGDFTSAETQFKESLVLAQQINHPASIVNAYGSLGAVKTQTGRTDEAIALLNEALAVAKENHLDDLEGITLGNLAEAHARAGDKERAVALHMQRRESARRTGDRVGFALSTANIGITQFELGNREEALKFLHVAVHEFRTLGMGTELARALAYLGVTYEAQGDRAHAMSTYELHIELCRKIDDFSTSASSYANLSEILFRKGEREQAVRVATEGYEQLRRLGSPDAARLAKSLAAWQKP